MSLFLRRNSDSPRIVAPQVDVASLNFYDCDISLVEKDVIRFEVAVSPVVREGNESPPYEILCRDPFAPAPNRIIEP